MIKFLQQASTYIILITSWLGIISIIKKYNLEKKWDNYLWKKFKYQDKIFKYIFIIVLFILWLSLFAFEAEYIKSDCYCFY